MDELVMSDPSEVADIRTAPVTRSAPAKAPSGMFAVGAVELHTAQAERVWSGVITRPNAIGVRPPGTVSVNIVSGALRFCYLATGDDMPWADFALIRWEQAIAQVQQVCQERTAAAQAVLQLMATNGVHVSVVARPTPQRFQLTTYTPYHGVLLETFALWDNTVRHYLTLESAGKASREQTRDIINGLRNLLVGPMEAIVRACTEMRRSGVPLTRAVLRSQPADTPEAIAAKERVMAAHAQLVKRFGTELPSAILSGSQRATHRRDVKRQPGAKES